VTSADEGDGSIRVNRVNKNSNPNENLGASENCPMVVQRQRSANANQVLISIFPLSVTMQLNKLYSSEVASFFRLVLHFWIKISPHQFCDTSLSLYLRNGLKGHSFCPCQVGNYDTFYFNFSFYFQM
jgi:hypothetical protein